VGIGRSAGAGEETSHAISDLGHVKARILASHEKPVSVSGARELLRTLRPDGSWPDVDYHDQRRSSWATCRHLSNVMTLAQAYRSAASDLHGDPEIGRAVLTALDYWLEHDFQNPNWWWNRIGVPRTLAPILLLMEDDLSHKQRDGGLAILRRSGIGMTGQNLVWVTEITALRGILENDADLVATAYRRIAEEIRLGSGEGVQPDFSFHQHGPCLYNHGYGAAFAGDCSRIAKQVAGTRMAFPPEKIAILSGLILDGSGWMARGGASDFGAEGREITRHGQNAGYLAAAATNMLALATGREEEFRALAARASGKPAPALEGNRHFWRSDLMTHHRKGYYTSARMFSRRIANTDDPCNSEGLLSHHVADGCNLLMQTGREYHDVYPLWDWQKIPGTTVEQRPELTGSPRRQGERSFVGGVSDGRYGVAAFDLARDRLAARKSWFFFDDEYVCLGAGITCPSEHSVVTTLNQCRLEGDVTASVGGQSQTLDPGSHVLEGPSWVWHDRTAYVPLRTARAHLRNEAAHGSWRRINARYSDAAVAGQIFSLWIDHGAGPTGARYAYVVVPNVEPSSVDGYVARPPVKILENTPAIQAVWHEKLAVAGTAFYEAGRVDICPNLAVAVDVPCLVLLREHDERLTVSVSNPENQKATVRVEIVARGRSQGKSVPEAGARVEIVVELPDGLEAGRAVTRSVTRP
jgi:chondroitin AC lyase